MEERISDMEDWNRDSVQLEEYFKSKETLQEPPDSTRKANIRITDILEDKKKGAIYLNK